MNATDKLGMQEESEDQGFMVTLPPDEGPAGGAEGPGEKGSIGTNGQESLANGGRVDDGEDGEGEGSDDEGDGTDADREAIRQARREERRLKKQLHREKSRESNSLINVLKKQNQEMAGKIANLENRTSGAELARVDKVIQDTGVEVEYAKMKIVEATRGQDGEAMVKAQELLFDAKERLKALQAVRNNATQQMNRPPQQAISAPSTEVQKMATEWMKRNTWYNPAGADVDSQVTQTIDRALTAEGFDPSDEDYWDELDDRLKKYIPHRVSGDAPRPGKKPGGAMTSSGRESSAGSVGPNQFRVSPERVKALKEAGQWDDPTVRMKMIKRYAEYDRANKGRS